MTAIQRTLTRVNRSSIAARRAGSAEHPAFVFLHGWPQSSRSYLRLMTLLAREYFVLALDLPGVSGSRGSPPVGEKRVLARLVREVIRANGAQSVILVGHDAGGMIVFSFLRQFGAELDGAVIANTVIPGLSPWEKVISNPQVWHFAFHAIQNLPETLVAGHQRAYFDYFFDALAYDKSALTQELRDAYASDYGSVDALRAGFQWYRACNEDARQNQSRIEVRTPTLYLRGEKEPGDINEYLQGLRASGLAHVTGRVIPECGHFSADEAPDQLARILRDFRAECDHSKSAPMKAVGEI